MSMETSSPADAECHAQQQVPSPSKDTDHIFLRRGDLVRISESGIEKAKRLKDRDGFLGRIAKCSSFDGGCTPSSFRYDVEWVLGGKLCGVEREDLVFRTADDEGMTDVGENRRRKRPPSDFMEDVARMEESKKSKRESSIFKQQHKKQQKQQLQSQTKENLKKKSSADTNNSKLLLNMKKKPVPGRKGSKSIMNKRTPTSVHNSSKQNQTSSLEQAGNKVSNSNKRIRESSSKQLVEHDVVEDDAFVSATSSSMDLYERHRREFRRFLTRLKEKVDSYRHFWPESENVPPIFDEVYDDDSNSANGERNVRTGTDSDNYNHDIGHIALDENDFQARVQIDRELKHDEQNADSSSNEPTMNLLRPGGQEKVELDQASSIFPPHPPFNWEMVERRLKKGRYVLDRLYQEEEDRFKLFNAYYDTLDSKERPTRIYKTRRRLLPLESECILNEAGSNVAISQEVANYSRAAYPLGVDWSTFRDDVVGMCDAALLRSDMEDDCGQRGSLSHTVKRIKEALDQALERTAIRHAHEMAIADDRHRFALAIEKYENKEAAMQSWRKTPFPERRYVRVTSDAVCSGLSRVDELIAQYELRTNLPDSFIGQSYHYNDTSLSEVWMKSVVDETQILRLNKRSGNTMDSKKKACAARNDQNQKEAAFADLSNDDGVTRAQVTATMQALLIAVQDKVMTESKVLQQHELKSCNWENVSMKARLNGSDAFVHDTLKAGDEIVAPPDHDDSMQATDIVEKPVWGIDCYTRRNICVCLELEFNQDVALAFIEKWLLPAINACPDNLAQDVGNAARILEGLPFDYSNVDTDEELDPVCGVVTMEDWSLTPLARVLLKKIEASRPPWLKAASKQLRCARNSLGPNFFRVHPKGNGSVLLCPRVKANTLVTFYHGELYPSWRWGEKMDAIEITQQRKNLKPALPDFYNMALERPQKDPRGYGLLFVDASRKAGHGSCLSHSCVPTCEVRVAAVNGELCLAMTTLRELEWGEELTFDYNAVTESLNEYRSAVCLCGYGKCRGSFLHFATADIYQQILTRNSPIASRFASLIKGSMKKVLSEDDEKVLKCHGFQTAAFGAISVNQREFAKDEAVGMGLVDSMNMVPIWLQTYVADTLRYIEYERRALPIALISDNRATNTSCDISEEGINSSLAREPKPEPSFFYFARTQTDFIRTLIEKAGLPPTLIGLQRHHAIQRVASNYWQGLDEEQRQHWKDQARADYEKKLKKWRAEQKASDRQNALNNEKKKVSVQGTEEFGTNLSPANISFQDADAEGLSAMEQRIQQLTQSLSRVGRVLYRHREQSFQADLSSGATKDVEDEYMFARMRSCVHEPITMLTDITVIDWIWNDSDGPVSALLRGVERSRCARPALVDQLRSIKKSYPQLDACNDQSMLCNQRDTLEQIDATGLRTQLTEGLLALRKAIIDDLKEMSAIFKQVKGKRNLSSGQSKSSVHSIGEILSIHPSSVRATENSDDVSDTPTAIMKSECTISVKEIQTSESRKNFDKALASNESSNVLEDFQNLRNGRTHTIVNGHAGLEHSRHQNENGALGEVCSWVSHYDERLTLEACADVILLYARTINFFVIKPYKELESTPVDVYARELGNTVPKSVIDDDLESKAHPRSSSGSQTDDVKNLVIVRNEERIFKVSGRRQKPSLVCEPDETIARVTVKYQGDYVLSQLLQWYNGGIGQKPGIPDLLGCAMLPSLSDCFDSELLASNRIKADRKTSYEIKVRPRLAEWFRDSSERGNPWPTEIRKAFTTKECAVTNISKRLIPFGSPVLDFLVSGDDTNITALVRELGEEENVVFKASSDGLLSSVDKGRPAQAVSTWVQCEECMKWRKIPWHVDADMLPEKFFCKDNIWNAAASSCDAPEDVWDDSDALVADGKVEGSKSSAASSINDDTCFVLGSRFDVQREGKTKFTVGTVVKVDVSGLQKRVKFHFSKTSSDRDEWIPFDSKRIAPLYSKVHEQSSKKENHGSTSIRDDASFLLDKKNFTLGARFDVRRCDKENFSTAIVTSVDFSENSSRIKFHFAKTSTCRDEWIELGSDRIAALGSKTILANKTLSKCCEDEEHETLATSDFKNRELKPNKKVQGKTTKGKLKRGKKIKISIKKKKSTKTRKLDDACLKDKVLNGRKEEKSAFAVTFSAINSDGNGLEQTQKLQDRAASIESEEPTGLETTAATSSCNSDGKELLPLADNCDSVNDPVLDSQIEHISCASKADLIRESSFTKGARFDVCRTGKSKYYVGVVKAIDYAGSSTKVLFHFPKTHIKFDEWIEVGSPRICPLYTRVPRKLKPKTDRDSSTTPHIVKLEKMQHQSFSLDNNGDGDGAPSDAADVDALNHGNHTESYSPLRDSDVSNNMFGADRKCVPVISSSSGSICPSYDASSTSSPVSKFIEKQMESKICKSLPHDGCSSNYSLAAIEEKKIEAHQHPCPSRSSLPPLEKGPIEKQISSRIQESARQSKSPLKTTINRSSRFRPTSSQSCLQQLDHEQSSSTWTTKFIASTPQHNRTTWVNPNIVTSEESNIVFRSEDPDLDRQPNFQTNHGFQIDRPSQRSHPTHANQHSQKGLMNQPRHLAFQGSNELQNECQRPNESYQHTETYHMPPGTLGSQCTNFYGSNQFLESPSCTGQNGPSPLAAFDKLLLLASASHGQIDQSSINASSIKAASISASSWGMDRRILDSSNPSSTNPPVVPQFYYNSSQAQPTPMERNFPRHKRNGNVSEHAQFVNRHGTESFPSYHR